MIQLSIPLFHNSQAWMGDQGYTKTLMNLQ